MTPEENRRLTQVGPGTPMGGLLRRYWQPACLSSELPEADGAPLRVRLLCEDLIAFRDSEAHVGLASAQIALNDLNGARSELDSMLRSQPTPDVYVTLGELNLKENKLDAASEAVAQALHLEPGNSAALQLKHQLASKLNATAPQNQ